MRFILLFFLATSLSLKEAPAIEPVDLKKAAEDIKSGRSATGTTDSVTATTIPPAIDIGTVKWSDGFPAPTEANLIPQPAFN